MAVALRKFDLVGLRKTLGLTQSEMAKRIGLSLRTYQELELNSDKVRRRHVRLAESVALDVAVEKNNPMLAPASIRKKALKLAGNIMED
jgi:DNA-binding XRE family transcriptional regulator